MAVTEARPPGSGERHGSTSKPRRVFLGLVLSATSAVLIVLSEPPYALWPLAWFEFVPMVVAQHYLLPRRYAGWALAAGVGAPMLYGLVTIAGGAAVPAVYAIVVAMVVVLRLYGGFERWYHERTGYRQFLWLTPLVGVSVDLARASIPLSGTWGYLSYTQYRQVWLIQPVSVFGILALNLLIALTNYAIAQLVLSRLRPEVSTRRAVRACGALALTLVAWTVLSLALLRSPVPTVRVAAVQPGHPFAGYTMGQPVLERTGVRELVDGTRAAAARGARLVVWRELGLPDDPRTGSTEALRALAAETQTHIVIGYSASSPRGRRNEATVLTPDGRFLGTYRKAHPATPIGERSIRGNWFPVFATPFGRLATIICYDLDFLDTARNVARNGAQIVAVPSDDMPGGIGVASKHYTMLVFRAIENRLTMIKADIAYDSAIIDPYGRILASHVSPDGAAVTLVADVPVGSGDAPARSIGDAVGWLGLAACIVLLVSGLRRRA